MSVIEWKQEFKTGIPSIDYEHEHLIAVINDLADTISVDAPLDEIEFHLGEIYALIEAHFALEEKIMRDMKYLGYAEHKEDHDRLLDEIRDIMENVAKDGAFDYRVALGERVGTWFGLHFKTLDPKLHALIHGAGYR
ncbi:MAG: hemerythrin family protein [Rhodospirillales bacterium]|jgi:hemerythrin-like metal-binding protein|nr:hemerythrin family protein [Rhodospirillales bacterium]MDP6774119.1 hemerythrin family protein [Rhodospirillales bacterium]